MVYSKVQPQAKDVEEAILGGILMDAEFGSGELGYDVKNILNPEDFYVDNHQRVCRAIYQLLEENKRPISLSVVQWLREKQELETCGGPFFISTLTSKVVNTTNTLHHSRIVKQYSIARKLISVSGEILGLAHEEGTDVFSLLEIAERRFYEINQEIEEITTVDKSQTLVNVGRMFEERRSTEDTSKFLKSGLKDFDGIIGYFKPAVYVIAARPAMGKTDIIIQMICNIAKEHEVGFISAEMTDEEIYQRMICNTAELDNEVWIKEPHLITKDDEDRFMFGMAHAYNLKLHVESRTNRIDRIVNKIKFWVRKLGVRIVFIDFLQILTIVDELAKYMTDVQIINYILEQIRSASKELKIPIVLLSQLNRELYKRGNKEPGLSDLKGSGKIEEIAYMICFLHRPEYYDITEDDEGESTKGLMYMMIQKHRGGKSGKVKNLYIPKYSKLEPWDRGLPGGFNPMGASFNGFKNSLPGPATDLTF